ncbi:MAG: putative bifunctional diguanylate cyclase/phosphodiesterase [Granulosicoccus sp.]
MSITHPAQSPKAKRTAAAPASLADELDALAAENESEDAANDSGPERRQYELLLLHALKATDSNYAFVLNPAGRGAYAEQFVKLAAAAERNPDGQVQICHDSLASRRPDPMILSIMRLRRGVSGKPTDIGLPSCLPGSHPPIRYFIMLPIEAGVSCTSVLFIANPSRPERVNGEGGLMETLTTLVKTLTARQRSAFFASPVPNVNSGGEDSGARHYVQLMSASINAVVITDTNATITAFNPAAENLFGRASARALGTAFDRYLPQEFLMPILKHAVNFDTPSSAGEILPIRQRSVSAVIESGNTVHLRCSAYYTRVAGSVYTTFVFEHENESAPIQDNSTSHQQFKALTNVAPVGIVQLGADWTCDYANDMWCQLSGLSMDETLGEGWVDAIHAEDVVDALVELRESLSNSQIFSRNIRLQKPTGKISWVTLSATITISETGHFSGCLLVLLDVTDTHLASEKLRFAASHDVLTGLANRSAFLDQLQERLNSAQKRTETALLYLDLDGFKSINDTLGHDCGDELLREVADRLVNSVPSEDLCARLGGDEFTIIVSSVSTQEEVCNLAERIVRNFNETFHVFDNELHLSTSIGIALAGVNSTSSDEFIKQADTALYKAKSSGRSRWVVYTKEFQNEDLQRSVLQARVRRATERQEFSLVYQPQYRLDNTTIVGFEALLRWAPSDITVPDTQTLVDSLEDSGLINEVGQWVLETACQQYARWEHMGLLPDNCTMSVNVSPAQLSLANFVPRLEVILERCNMSASLLNLEITESALIEKNSSCIRVIEQAKALGVSVSLDDFGTGYASLSYLTRLPIDYLKIDKSFIVAMDSDEPSKAIVMSVLAMAATLDIDVVAEGIENRSTLEVLRGTSCKYAQGYFLCRPGTSDALETLLIQNSYSKHELIELT